MKGQAKLYSVVVFIFKSLFITTKWSNNNSSYCHAFTIPLSLKQHHVVVVVNSNTKLRSSSTTSQNNDDEINNNNLLVQNALPDLSWETIEKTNAKPILDLSAIREDSFDQQQQSENSHVITSNDNNNVIINNEEIKLWNKGQYWNNTKDKLQETWNLVGDNDLVFNQEDFDKKLLSQCPQLYRLPTDLILDTADFLCTTWEPKFMLREPKLLSYPRHMVEYGVEFLTTMMMLPSRNATVSICTPDLLLASVEGGLQEQNVMNALNAASSATQQANQQAIGSAMSMLQQLNNRKT